ncbi:MAG TPA: DUF3108 domain-containing protein [Desulfuromonadales bacterium]|nr:DUF3108 domain-containing protein [Desulfuromonadales bacterium]
MLQQRPNPIETFVGERLHYKIAFLWFSGLAEANLSFSRGKKAGTYRAVLEARTLGIAAWLTSDRVQRYVSLMTLDDKGHLRSLVHESHMIKGRGEKKQDRFSRYVFDYRHHRIVYRKAREGHFYLTKTYPLDSKHPPNDILTAFYNFRAGFFGPLKPGAHFEVPTFNRKGTTCIIIDVLSNARPRKLRFFPKGGILCRVKVDKDVFGTGGGAIYAWIDPLGRPARGIVEDVIGMGDVRGMLTPSKQSAGGNTPSH